MNSVREQLLADIDASAGVIRSGLEEADKLQAAQHAESVALDKVEQALLEALRRGVIKDEPVLKRLRTVADRIRRIRELRNQAEVGSFSVQAKLALQAAWEALP